MSDKLLDIIRIAQCLKKSLNFLDHKKIDDQAAEYFQNLDNLKKQCLNNIDILKENATTGTRQKKNHRPDVILEEIEEVEEEDGASSTSTVPSAIITKASSPVQSTTTEDVDSTTTGRPKRAATTVAREKMHIMNEISNKSKLRRPSDFDKNDVASYNIYNQTTCKTEITITDFAAPRTKRRKGSGNSTVTSMNFFSSTLLHASSPKVDEDTVNVKHNIDVSAIHGPTSGSETFVMNTDVVNNNKAEEKITSSENIEQMEVDEVPTARTRNAKGTQKSEVEENRSRTRVISGKDETVVNSTQTVKRSADKEDEEVSMRTRTRRQKKGATDNNESTAVTKSSVLENNNTFDKSKDKSAKNDSKKDDSKGLEVEHIEQTDVAPEEETSLKTRTRTIKKHIKTDSESSSEDERSTRTHVVKKPITNIENLMDIAQNSPLRNIGDNIKSKLKVFEVNSTLNEIEGRVTRTKTRNNNNNSGDEKSKADPFKVPFAVKNKEPKRMIKKPEKIIKDTFVDPKQIALEEKKRIREERAQKAAAARDQAEKEKREHALKLEKEKEEKLKLKKQRDEKLREETDKKRLAAQQKQAQIEQHKREQEAAKAARLKELIEQEERKAAQCTRKKELEMQGKKLQEVQKLDKPKTNNVKVDSKEDEWNYSISEEHADSDDDDDEHKPKKPVPKWATRAYRNIRLQDQIYVAHHYQKLFSNPYDLYPQAVEFFGPENIKLRPRTSSAVWNHNTTGNN